LTCTNQFHRFIDVNLHRINALSNNSGHCLETHTGSHLEDEDTATTANTVISDSTIVNPSTVFLDRTRPLSTNSGHCLENDARSRLEDENTATSSNMVWNSMTQNPLGIIQSYRRGNIYRERMNKLLQLKNQIPIDVFLIVFVACQAQDDIVNQ
jgi:hypothetical protein